MCPSRKIPDEQQISRPVITREEGSRSSDLQLEHRIVGMALNDLTEMKETVDTDFETIREEEGSRISDLQLEHRIVGMALNDLKEMKKTVDTDFETIRKEVDEIWTHLRDANRESEALKRELGSSFERLKKMFCFEDRPNSKDKKLEVNHLRACQHYLESIAEMFRKKENKVPTIADLLMTIRRELEDLGAKTKKNTVGMLKEMKRLKDFARQQHLSLKYENKGLGKKFIELEELIQRCCTIKKIPLSVLEGSSD